MCLLGDNTFSDEFFTRYFQIRWDLAILMNSADFLINDILIEDDGEPHGTTPIK